MKYLFSLMCIFTFAAFSILPTAEQELATPLTLSASQKTAAKGGEVCLDVTAKGFEQIVSMQYTMKWSPKVLKYKGVTGFKLPGMSAQNFGNNNTAKGQLTFSWFDFNVRGISVPDGTSIYQVCFEAIGESGSKGYFQFTGTPTIIEIANVREEFLDLNGVNGVVKIR